MRRRQLSYVLQRLIRNLLPPSAAKLARRHFGGIPGGESDAPESFAAHYAETLGREGRALSGSRVLVFGHGPSYGFGCALLAAGAEHVYLWDPYAAPDSRANAHWLERYPEYLERRGRVIEPHAGWMTVLDPNEDPQSLVFPAVDVVLSTSVFEHLDEVELWTEKLARAIEPGGINVHMIDLRDHFFAQPFEMLCYSRQTWERWLNPRQNLNRWRYDDYQRVFQRHFGRVEIEILEHDVEAFAEYADRVRPEFGNADPHHDAILEIEVCAWDPIPRRQPERPSDG